MADEKISIWTHISQLHNGLTRQNPEEVVELSSDSETGSEDSLFEVIQPKKRRGNPEPAASQPLPGGDPPRVTDSDNLGASNDKATGPSSTSATAGTSSGTDPVPFVDPIADFITELYGSGSNTGNEDHVSEVPSRKKLVMEKENNKTPIPGPSSSSHVTKSKKRVRFRSPSSSGSSDGSESPVVGAKRARRSLRLSSPLSDNGNNKGKSSSSEADSNDDDESDDEIPVTPRKRCTRRSKPVISDYDCTPPIAEEPEKKKKTAKIRRKSLRSSTEKRKKASEKELALERLRQKMEARKVKQAEKKANKAASSSSRRDESKEKENGDDTGESDDDGSDCSDSGSGSSPCPVVSDGEVSSSDASDCSVATAAETDEEPDLGSGSEGEKELEKEDSEDNEEDKSDRSCSSSEDGEPDDGQNDARCLLCKDLGSRKFEGRAALRTTTSWCKCGECEIFAEHVGDYDLICCKEIKTVAAFLKEELEDDVCITDHPRFQKDVLENAGYARAISKHNYSYNFRSGGGSSAYYDYYHADKKKSEQKYDNAIAEFKNADRGGRYRKSLRSYKYWIFDCINNPANEIVIPACVLATVRDYFEIHPAYYQPFSTNHQCPTGRHCRLARDPNLVNPNPPQ